MEANEIRINNIIHQEATITLSRDRYDNATRDESNDADIIVTAENISEIVKNSANFSGIPLTEEWLLKLGLKKNYDGNYGGDFDFSIEPKSFDVIVSGAAGWENYERAIGKPLSYVHQLQNLYFALTGEELTIKP